MLQFDDDALDSPACLECNGTRTCPECRGTGSDFKGGQCYFCDGDRKCPYCEPEEGGPDDLLQRN